MLPLEDLVRCQVAKELKGSLPYIQGGGLQQSFLFHQVFEKGPVSDAQGNIAFDDGGAPSEEAAPLPDWSRMAK